jgi:hypothetical protein
MSKRNPRSPEPFTSILARVFENRRGKMSETFAREVLELGFGQADQDRIADLMERNQAGGLPPAEKTELDEFARVGTFLSILQAQARIALKSTAKAQA